MNEGLPIRQPLSHDGRITDARSDCNRSMPMRFFQRDERREGFQSAPGPKAGGAPRRGQEALGDLRGKRAAGNRNRVGEGVDVVAKEGLALAEDHQAHVIEADGAVDGLATLDWTI